MFLLLVVLFKPSLQRITQYNHLHSIIKIFSTNSLLCIHNTKKHYECVLVYCSAGVFANGQTSQNYEFSLHLKRGNSLIGGNTQPTQFKGTNVLFSGVNAPESASTGTFFYLDSPSTTNSITYNLCLQGGESITYGVGRSYNDGPGTLYNYQNSPGTSIILLEVSA